MQGYVIREPGTPAPPRTDAERGLPPAFPTDGSEPGITLVTIAHGVAAAAGPQRFEFQVRLPNGAMPELWLDVLQDGNVTIGLPLGWADRERWGDTILAAVLRQWPARLGAPPVPHATVAANSNAPDRPAPPSVLERIRTEERPGELRALLQAQHSRLRIHGKRAADLRAQLAEALAIEGALAARSEWVADNRRAAIRAGLAARVPVLDSQLAELAIWAESFELIRQDFEKWVPEAERREAELIAEAQQRLAPLPARRAANANVVLDPTVTLAGFIAAVRDEAEVANIVQTVRAKLATAGIGLAEVGDFDIAPKYRTSLGWGGQDGGLVGALKVPGVAPPDAPEAPPWIYLPPQR